MFMSVTIMHDSKYTRNSLTWSRFFFPCSFIQTPTRGKEKIKDRYTERTLYCIQRENREKVPLVLVISWKFRKYPFSQQEAKTKLHLVDGQRACSRWVSAYRKASARISEWVSHDNNGKRGKKEKRSASHFPSRSSTDRPSDRRLSPGDAVRVWVCLLQSPGKLLR